MEPKHTTGPWQIKSDYEPLSIIGNVDGPDDGQMHYTPICEVEPTNDARETAANAALIVRAVNAHAGLVAALECVLSLYGDGFANDVKATVRAALARATGDQP